MEKVNSFQTAFYVLAFVVPGFIWHSVLALFVRQKEQDEKVFILKCFTLSCLNYAICSGLVYLSLYTPYFLKRPLYGAVLWTFMLLVSPVVMGVTSGVLINRGVLTNWLALIGVARSSTIPAAWDVRFGDIAEVWMLVTMTDGSTVAGFFGPGSCASEDPAERDIYISEVWDVRDDGTWQARAMSEGILIRGEEIRHMEFFNELKELNEPKEQSNVEQFWIQSGEGPHTEIDTQHG